MARMQMESGCDKGKIPPAECEKKLVRSAKEMIRDWFLDFLGAVKADLAVDFLASGRTACENPNMGILNKLGIILSETLFAPGSSSFVVYRNGKPIVLRQNGKAQNIDLTGENLSGLDLHGIDLKDAKLVNADLRNTDFTEADLTGVDFTGADLTGVKLTGANIAGAKLGNAKVDRAALGEAKPAVEMATP